VITTVIVVLVVVVGGWLAYRYLHDALAMPSDLAALGNRDSVLAQISSKTPAPAAGSKLTPGQVKLYIEGLDSVNVGWNGLMTALDTIRSQSDSGASITSVKTWIGKSLLREIIRLPLVSRRGVVNYLNLHGISWAEYNWIKERTVAASMITQADYDSAMHAEIREHLPPADADSKKNIAPRSTDGLFKRVEAIRASGDLDSAEIALVAPHRSELLTKGLPSLVGLDTDLDSKVDVGLDEDE
jgi:hypothetical protein